MSDELLTFDIEEIETRTANAVLLKLCGVEVAVWLPLSEVEILDDTVEIPRWLAEKECLTEDDKDVL